jgi:hypothetical protein
MVRALARAGQPALGVDMSAEAVRASRARGGAALQRLVSDRLPAEGRWGTALLMDGNLGIGGDLDSLLRRCAQLVDPTGLIICEVDPVRDLYELGEVVLRSDTTSSPPIAWVRVGAAGLGRVAARCGLRPVEEWSAGRRAFVTLSSAG